ncbi:MAG: superoxide dismutase family protein [Gemmatimonadaceae bacterium]
MISRTRALVSLCVTSVVVATACSRAGRGDSSQVAHATMRNGAGETIGTAQLKGDGQTVQIELNVSGLTTGAHGVHLHMVGKCEGPAFASAGGHVNPTGAKHGVKNPQGPHAGDLPNAAGGGTTRYTTKTLRMTMEGGAATLFDSDGTALVLHADPDDEMTDPTGNSGARIACGVIERG